MKPVTTLPPLDDIARRIRKVQDQISQQGLDALICHDPANIFYLTHFANFVHERPFILVVPARGRLKFIIPLLEAPHVQSRTLGEVERVTYSEYPAPLGQQWSDRLGELVAHCKTVGVEAQCPLSVIQALPRGMAHKTTQAVETVRQIKSDYEIGRIAYTCELVSMGHELLMEKVRPGRMIMDLHTRVTKKMTRQLLLDMPNANMLNTHFAAVAQPPKLSHDPHNFTDVLMTFSQGGPHVTIVNGVANGYGAEVERTFFINRIPEKARAPFGHMVEAREKAFSLIKPGVSMAWVDQEVNAFLKSKGYADNLLHRTGHGFGVTEHEGPYLAEGYDHPLRENMVLSIEPGIYLPGIGGFRFSDTVWVTADGVQCLTQAPTDLKDLTLSRSPSLADKGKKALVQYLQARTGKRRQRDAG